MQLTFRTGTCCGFPSEGFAKGPWPVKHSKSLGLMMAWKHTCLGGESAQLLGRLPVCLTWRQCWKLPAACSNPVGHGSSVGTHRGVWLLEKGLYDTWGEGPGMEVQI